MIPQTVLHYEIEELIGEGGMGVVYAARDRKLNRRVALKFLPAKLVSSPESLERLRQEARAISALNHPHIETIYDLDDVDGQPFLVLEYLPGGTLRNKLEAIQGTGKKLALNDALRYAIEAAEGLAHAHRQGVLHCDIKTSNLMLAAEGAVKITDFGLARLADATAGAAEHGTVMGTLSYMSPEQARGQELDARTDIFSFGVVLFELLTGRLPFQSSDPTVLHPNFQATPVRRLRELRPDVPEALEGVVIRALQKQRDDRYQSASHLLSDLKNVQHGLAC
jgi:serine/threonine protein kinase